MRAVVIVAHPVATSFAHAAARAACDGLTAAGHQATMVDLYALGFRAAMSADEHRAYQSAQPALDDLVRGQIDLVKSADVLVFVYPTWWSSLPAILKGWLERVMVENVGFRFDHRGRVRPGLTHVRHIVGISTYGSPRSYVAAINDNGRRILTRALRLSTGWRTTRTWLGLYAIDTCGDDQRAAFLAKVTRTMREL